MSFGPCFLPIAIDAVPLLAVAVGRSNANDPRYFHAAIVYRGSAGVKALDFGLDGSIGEPILGFLDRCIWAIPKVPARLALQIIARCEAIASKPPRFIYDFEFTRNVDFKNHKTHFTIEGNTKGFTCATFVLAIFQSLNMPLVKLEPWSRTQADIDWQKSLLNILRGKPEKYNTTAQNLDVMEEKINAGCLRYSPMDAIGACRVGGHPTECGPCKIAAEECERWLGAVHAIVTFP